jgi:putative protease
LLSSKDLCLIEYLPEVLAAGITSVKIEGRMKSSYYVAVVTRTYRQALDELTSHKETYHCNPQWLDELKKISHRGYTTGFAFSKEKITETSPEIKNIQTHEPAGIVLGYDNIQKRMVIEIRNYLKAGEDVELLLPHETAAIDTQTIVDTNGNKIDQAHAGNKIFLSSPFPAPTGTLLRKVIRNRLTTLLGTRDC